MDDHKKGFIDKCAEHGINSTDAEEIYKEAQLASLLKSMGGAAVRGTQRLGEQAIQYGAKGLNKIPGVGSRINSQSKALVPYGARGGAGPLGDIASGNLFLNPWLSRAAGLGTMGTGYGLYKWLTSPNQPAQPQMNPYAAMALQPKPPISPEGMSGVLPYMT